MDSEKKPDIRIIPFSSQAAWRDWLDLNHSVSDGIWLQFYKKGTGTPSVVYAEALEEALCFGWIDGQLRRGDENFYLQRFTPRRRRLHSGSICRHRKDRNTTPHCTPSSSNSIARWNRIVRMKPRPQQPLARWNGNTSSFQTSASGFWNGDNPPSKLLPLIGDWRTFSDPRVLVVGGPTIGG